MMTTELPPTLAGAYPAHEYPTGVNPRWVACHLALGRRPKGYEFIVWIGQQWRAFLDAEWERGVRTTTGRWRDWTHYALHLGSSSAAHVAFDRWLLREA